MAYEKWLILQKNIKSMMWNGFSNCFGYVTNEIEYKKSKSMTNGYVNNILVM